MHVRPATLALALAAVPFAAGCGGGGSSKPKSMTPAGKPDSAAKQTAQRYLDAYNAKDPNAICRTLAARVRKQLADNKGTCEKTVKSSLKGTYDQLQVKEAYADGSAAAATVVGSQRQVQLVREQGSWKVIDGGS
jgi:hypothetical protein